MRRIGALVAIAVVAAGCASYPHHVSFATIDADPAWSPDGRFVAFASSRLGGGIYVVRPDGSSLRRLIPGAVSDVVWSPDGHRLAYLGRGGLYVASANGGGRSRILGRRYSSPAWSPDGRSIVVAGGDALYLVEPDGSGLRRVDGSGSLTEPAWSPDGGHIVAEGAGGSIVALAVNGGRRLRISPRGYEPAWSPDGCSVAFQSEGILMVANSDGTGGVRQVADEKGVASAGGHPAWSPDSKRIAFEVVHDRGRFVRRAMSLSIVDASTDAIARLTYGGSAWDDPAWRDGIVGKSTF